MKRFTVPCKFGNVEAPFHIYVGAPRKTGNPLQNQASWLSTERGGAIPVEVMESFEKLHRIAIENNVNFEDLCVYALGMQDAGEPKGNSAKYTDEKPNVRRYITGHEWSSYAKGQRPAGDSMLENTPEQTAARAIDVAGTIWLGNDELSRSARSLFLALTLYLGVVPDKELTLSEIFRTITSEDVTYSICVVMDTHGACISPLCYGLFNLWVNNHREFRNQVLVLMASNMIEFATLEPEKTHTLHDMRASLRKSFFNN